VPQPNIDPAGDGAGLRGPYMLPAAVRPRAFAAERINPDTGELESLTVGRDPVQAAVITAARTERGTGGSVQSTGQRFRDVRKLGPTGTELLRTEAQKMFAPLVAQGLARVLNVTITGGDDEASASVVVAWRNLLDGTDRSIEP
jgi:hypothetical protein